MIVVYSYTKTDGAIQASCNCGRSFDSIAQETFKTYEYPHTFQTLMNLITSMNSSYSIAPLSLY